MGRSLDASKDLLHLERPDASSTPGAKLLSICQPKLDTNGQPSRPPSISGPMLPLDQSSVLSRVKAFLPVLDEANRKLAMAIEENGGEEFDIEVLNEGERAPYVEMDLALGLADLHTPEAVAAAEQLVNGQVLNALPSRERNDTETDDESTESPYEGDIKTNNEKDLHADRKKRPKIEQL